MGGGNCVDKGQFYIPIQVVFMLLVSIVIIGIWDRVDGVGSIIVSVYWLGFIDCFGYIERFMVGM